MNTATIAEVGTNFTKYVKASEKGPVVVTRRGKPAAILLAVDDVDDLERLAMAYSPRLRAILDAARKRIRSGGGIPHDEFWRMMEAEKKSKVRDSKKTG